MRGRALRKGRAMGTERRAAIDIGTVTARLLVADVDGNHRVEQIARRTVITHLGEGLTESGRLSAAGMRRVADAVERFVTEARELGAERVIAVATSASRDAGNSAEFLAMLEAAGARPWIISGEREAYLTFLGATYDLRDEQLLVADIGGGSTELVLGTMRVSGGERLVDLALSRSIDVGSRRVTELHLRSDPPTAREIDAAAGWIADELRGYFRGMKDRPREMVAVAGTATSLAAIDLGLDPYDPERVNGHHLAGSSLLDILENLAGMTLEQRRRVPGLEPERASVIIGGALILQAVMAYAGLPSTLVSEHDILYGMVLDLGMPAEAGR